MERWRMKLGKIWKMKITIAYASYYWEVANLTLTPHQSAEGIVTQGFLR
jgi:hypothetical protein